MEGRQEIFERERVGLSFSRVFALLHFSSAPCELRSRSRALGVREVRKHSMWWEIGVIKLMMYEKAKIIYLSSGGATTTPIYRSLVVVEHFPLHYCNTRQTHAWIVARYMRIRCSRR